ncbi:uncharacterized protein BDZ99DRAFT_521146 [Mytilinidion resinicola]|uniref:Uncharacterized protein n=1 Tax=Mytilinidion resinicola TaxID=574789 RepID=A0A6A6YM23_9PEZI|nr:uncharacterized protein BDZ99DRAFT_521146 [Mytilinidion resinicola]KAF2809831.1 hypothetical protein BDZ99DRAFT_521146 [Mytilinidion resinicola]
MGLFSTIASLFRRDQQPFVPVQGSTTYAPAGWLSTRQFKQIIRQHGRSLPADVFFALRPFAVAKSVFLDILYRYQCPSVRQMVINVDGARGYNHAFHIERQDLIRLQRTLPALERFVVYVYAKGALVRLVECDIDQAGRWSVEISVPAAPPLALGGQLPVTRHDAADWLLVRGDLPF